MCVLYYITDYIISVIKTILHHSFYSQWVTIYSKVKMPRSFSKNKEYKTSLYFGYYGIMYCF